MAELKVTGAIHNVQPGQYIVNVTLRDSSGNPVVTSTDATFEVPSGGTVPPVADAPSVEVT